MSDASPKEDDLNDSQQKNKTTTTPRTHNTNELTAEEIQALEERAKRAEEHNNDNEMDDTLGGLVGDDGKDKRRVRVNDEQEIENVEGGEAKAKRRKGAWRGIGASEDATIRYDFALKAFDIKIQTLVLGADLRVFAIFIVMFCFFFLVGRNIEDNFYFARAYKDPILGSEIAKLKVNKFFDDISEAADWNNFVVDVFLTQIIDPAFATGSHFVLGSWRLRTQRVKKNSCEINADIIPRTMPQSAQECYGEWSDKASDVKSDGGNFYNAVGKWSFKTCEEMRGGTATTGIIARYNCGGYYVEVPWWRPMTSLALANVPPFASTKFERMPRDETRDLYVVPVLYNNPPFIDNLATRFVVIEFFAFHPTLQTFFSFKLYAEQAPGGLWKSDYQSRVFNIWTTDSIPKTVFDAFFFLFWLYYVYKFFKDMHRFYQKEARLLAFFFNTWNLLELANLVIFGAVFVIRILWIVKCTQTDFNIDKLTFSQRYPVELDDILWLYMLQIFLNSVNTVLTFLKLLKFFRLNDRLNVLTRTLAESQDSIIGVLLIFFLVVTAYAMTGHGLFGLGVWRFRSVDSSYSTLLLMLVGVFDYQKMKNENRVLAGFFFWSYIILGLFCLLNFLIGVLMEAFAEVSKTRSILPLETVLVKTWEDIKRVCHPSNIKATIVANVTGNSREELLQQSLDLLILHREVVYPPTEFITDEDKHTITKEIMLDALPEDLQENIGKEYLDYVWNDLVYEWDQSESANEAIEAQRNLAMTAKGVNAAMGRQLEVMSAFPSRLSKLETDLQRLVQILDGGA